MNLKIKKTKLFFLYYIIAALLFTLSVFMAPLWSKTSVFWKNWGVNGMYLIISLFLLVYLFGYLLKKITKKKESNIYIIRIVEFTLISVLTLLCFINQFAGFMSEFITVSRVLGLVIYIHGICGLFGNYLDKEKVTEKEKKFDLLVFIVNICLITLATFLIVKNIISTNVILWFFAIIILTIGIISIVIGSLSMPKKPNNKQKKIKNNNN